jgi:hypothetical protein
MVALDELLRRQVRGDREVLGGDALRERLKGQ